MKRKIAFHTIGCKLNFSETSAISEKFNDANFEKVHFNENADIYIINTCAVTAAAERKSQQTIKKIIHQHPNATVVAMGCYAQLNSKKLSEIKGVQLILGTDDKYNILNYLDEYNFNVKPKQVISEVEKLPVFNLTYSTNERTRVFLKVQDGCDYHCSYCSVPLARGRSRNGSISEIVSAANHIASIGVKEIIITGVNIGDFGKSTGESFLQLLKTLENSDVPRIRLSSIEPDLLTDELLYFIAQSKKIVPHFHLPLQSASNRVLQLMERRYNMNLIQQKLKTINALFTNACIGVDIITGFPGEMDDDFLETYSFLSDSEISYIHAFPYSERPNTRAILLPNKISYIERKNRVAKLRLLSKNKTLAFYKKHINKTCRVLFESKNNNGFMVGFSENYIKVETKYNPQFINLIMPVHIESINSKGFATGYIII